jgi:hypothetical protein
LLISNPRTVDEPLATVGNLRTASGKSATIDTDDDVVLLYLEATAPRSPFGRVLPLQPTR